MPNPLLLDIVTFFTSKGLIEGDGIDAYRDFVPEMPDNLVAVTEYKGSPPVHYEPMVHRSVQIAVRNKDADAARRKALELFKALQSDNTIVHFTPERWGQVVLRQSPFRSSTDSSDRVTYAFNMGITTTIE